MENVEGTVQEIIYNNDENGYTVCEISCDDESFIAVGCLPFVNIGDKLKLSGEWSIHIEYGEQFKVAGFEKSLPEGNENILLYLSSGAIRGIKSATAKKIVDTFGEKTLEIIQNEPEKLSKIKGISNDKATSIHNQFIKQLSVQKVIAFFSKYSITTTFAYKVYKQLGDQTVEKVKGNPYVMCEIEGIGFKTADKIAIAMGFDLQSSPRIDAAIIFCLSEASANGHTYLPAAVLCENVCELLNMPEDIINSRIISLLIESRLRRRGSDSDDAIYLPAFFTAEENSARMLTTLADYKPKTLFDNFEKEIASVLDEQIILADKQIEAVKYAMENGTVIITGGPGTGKTTIINTIIKLMIKSKLKIALGAPTGRAAKRMSEMCGLEAKTIHRLLEMEYSPDKSKLVFSRNSSNPLDADAVIIDEMSMVDILLFYHLLKALPQECRLILVGDCDQLPSVGAGNVLRDIIASGKLKTVCLTEIFRQAKESMIVVNAHKINMGEYPVCNGKDSDFFFLPRTGYKEGIGEIVNLCKSRLPRFLNAESLANIQVLSPMRRGEMGVENLNNVLQEVFNPKDRDKKELKRPGFVIREGDKVMQVRNNYDIEWLGYDDKEGKGIFNGDMGMVEGIDTDEGVLNILFDGEKRTAYPIDNIDDIELAYAITVHKSQGSEFTAVVIPMYFSHRNLLSRNLFYTAVTRAKKLVVLVGKEDMIKYMTDNNYEDKRFSGLRQLLCEYSSEKD